MMARGFVLGLGLLAAPWASGGAFPKPEPAKAFAEMKIYDASGRPWRAAQEDWTGAKSRAASSPEWAAWLKKNRTAADEWIQQREDRVSWVCGWWHDFVSPKDASRLLWTPAVPGEQVTFLTSRSDPHVAITPKIMGAWIYEFRGRHADMMLLAARLYRLTGAENYAAWASGQLDFYAKHYLEWPETGQGSRVYGQALDEATYGIKYCETARLLADYAGPDRMAEWRKKFFDPIARNLSVTGRGINNYSTWQRCATAQIALLYHEENLWRESLDGKYGLRRQMAEGITSDYLWWEQSISYNNYVIEATLSLFTAAGVAGRAEELDQEMSIAENLALSPVYMRFPDGHVPNPSDGSAPTTAPNRGLFANLYRVFPTGIGLEAAAGSYNWNTLLDPPPAPPAVVTVPPVTARNLASSQMAILRSGPWQVFVHYGQLTRGHVQAEALNFSAAYEDTDITHDTGTVGYGSPLHANYYSRALNHNVPIVNGEGEEPQPRAGRLISFAPDRVEVEQPNYNPDARAGRTLAIQGENLVDTVTLKATSQGPQKLGLALHVQGKVRLPPEFRPDSQFAKGRSVPFGYWRSVTGATMTDRVEFDVEYAKVTLHVVIATPGIFRIWHGDSPDTPPRRRESFYVETTGEKAVFITTFSPEK